MTDTIPINELPNDDLKNLARVVVGELRNRQREEAEADRIAAEMKRRCKELLWPGREDNE